MKRLAGSIAVGLLLVGALAGAAPTEEAARTIVVANAAEPESVELARHYMVARAIPAENLYALPLPEAEVIPWTVFVEELYNPLRARLVKDDWIDAIFLGGHDEWGRRNALSVGHRIAYLVTVRGVPLTVRGGHPQEPLAAERAGLPKTFHTPIASVDAELALLARDGWGVAGHLPNPLFNDADPPATRRGEVVRTARLDGPSAEVVRAMIDGALAAEGNGLFGRAYVDTSGPHTAGVKVLEKTAALLREAPSNVPLAELAVHEEKGPFPVHARFDAPALYFGWYSREPDGPFLLPGLRFPPGAIALSVHSYSAATLRDAQAWWSAPLLTRGAAVTVGNVHEPYLPFVHRSDLFAEALFEGAPVGEAAWRALPVVSWMAVLLGDPLYVPFPADGGRGAAPGIESPYAILAAARQLRDGGDEGAARKLLEEAAGTRPDSLPLRHALAEAFQTEGESRMARRALGDLRETAPWAPDQWGLLAEAAALQGDLGSGEEAVEALTALLEAVGVNETARLAFLRYAAKIARQAGESAAAQQWQLEREGLREQIRLREEARKAAEEKAAAGQDAP